MNSDLSEVDLHGVISLAATWQNRANELITSEEKIVQRRLLQLMQNPIDKAFLTKLIDQCFRSRDVARVADQISFLLRRNGFPEFFTLWDSLLMWLFLRIGRHIPRIAVPLMIDKIKKDSGRTVISGEKDALSVYLRQKREEGVRMNLNHLGEPVLGEREALNRLKAYINDLENPDIECISVKIATICPQFQPIAFDHNLKMAKDRLSQLYRAASSNQFVCKNGITAPKFVYLDIETYNDLEITATVFRETLDEPEFKNFTAGIALQAYFPDSCNIQRKLTDWAKKRVNSGGSPIKIRLVKGANIDIEQVNASIQGWPLATYSNKLDVDANYKRMVDFGLMDENFKAVRLGIASHNLFELAYAYQAATKHHALDSIIIEMLTGMADHVRRAICEISGEVILYAPVATDEEFINAIAYLIRRLDENTAKGNFLSHSYGLKPDSKEWNFLKDQFFSSNIHKNNVNLNRRRIQNRFEESFPEKTGTYHLGKFSNEPDTDWFLQANRKWAEKIRQSWKKTTDSEPINIPLVVAGNEIMANRIVRDCFDPSQINDRIITARFAMGLESDVDQAVETAKKDPDQWRLKTQNERHMVLSTVARELRKARGDLIGAVTAGTGKIFTESDVEVSEAIDFAEYYPYSMKTFIEFRNIQWQGKGVGVVLSSWNSPIAGPCSAITAALTAGNTVIFKPSSESVLPSWFLCQCFWNAGISKNTLQFIPGSGSDIGSFLACHLDVDFVIFTGKTDTGIKLLKQKPDIQLSAATSGKNAIIVTAVSDKDQAIDNIVYSAFSSSGQESSAISLLILEKEVYEDTRFKEQLIDAARSFKTGSAWDFGNRMGPLIYPPTGNLKKALTELEYGESWALKPQNIDNNPNNWTPGIKWDVQPGSFTHMTEFFGPVLGVMCAEDFDHAIKLVNQTGYGLVAGLESLDKRKQEKWKECIEAGNLYINRRTTGAKTLRQPFGGIGKSTLGTGFKTGGPNYVSQFLKFTETGSPAEVATQYDRRLLKTAKKWMRKLNWQKLNEYQTDIQKMVRALNSYSYHANHEFKMEKDYFHLRGQDNILKYIPISPMVIRVHQDDSLFEVLARITAAQIVGCTFWVSIPPGLNNEVVSFLLSKEGNALTKKVKFRYQSDEQLIAGLPEIKRIRYASPSRVPPSIYKAAAETGFYISAANVLMEGRIELLQYVQSQSISHNYHRYGNLGERTFDQSMKL